MESSEDTGEYDLETYAFALEQMRSMHLPCFWKITPLKTGAMLNMDRSGEQERIFVKSSKEMKEMSKTIIDWAKGD